MIHPQDVEPACTDCGGTGVTFQTERRCACQVSPSPSGDGPLSIIIAWYQELPKRARESLSLAHLHGLSKNISRTRQSTGTVP